MFPGYLFVNVPIQKRSLDILKVPSVVRIIGFNGEPGLIPETQVQAVKRLLFSTRFNSRNPRKVQAVKRLLFSTLPYDPYPYILEKDRVEIVRGPLRGL